MTTPMRFRAITANCSNDVIGKKASQDIVSHLNDEQLDFVVINCQEVVFEKTKKQLQQALGKDSGYSVKQLGKMVTHTKSLEQFHSNTGLASFVIHKNNLLVEASERVKARRSESRFSGAGFNKGGLVIDFTITDSSSSDKPIRLQTVNGHLDSTNISKRIQDWANIYRAIGKKDLDTWDELVNAMPNIRIAGYDANTRNQFVDEHVEAIKIWELKIVPQELKAFQQAPLGRLHFSADSTYKTSEDDITTARDPKRPGYVRGGMLDFVDIAADVDERSSSEIIKNGVTVVGSDTDSKRDHDVIISPLQMYDQHKMSEFDRVRNQMITQLQTCAPHVVKEMATYAVEDQTKLLNIYNTYLSKDGLISNQIELQANLLLSINKIRQMNKGLGDKIATILFTDKAWFSSSTDIKTKQALQSEISAVINACKTESDLNVVHNALHDPVINTAIMKDAFQGIIDLSNASILSEINQQCMDGVDDLLHRINSISFDSKDPETRAGMIIQALLEFMCDLDQKLGLLQQTNSPGKEGVCSVLLGMINQVRVFVKQLMGLFLKDTVKESYPLDKPAQPKKINEIVRHISLNLPAWLDRLRVNLKDCMESKDFSTLKSKAGTHKPDTLLLKGEENGSVKNSSQ